MERTEIEKIAQEIVDNPETSVKRTRATYRQLTPAECDILDREITMRRLARNDAQAAAQNDIPPQNDDPLPDELPEYTPMPRKRGTGHMVILRATGTLNIPQMQGHFGDMVEAAGRERARTILQAHLAQHIAQVCPDLDPDQQAEQMRFAANAIYAAHSEAAI